ncbi:MAG: glycosyl hydrolase [Thermomicrobiales bacterium]
MAESVLDGLKWRSIGPFRGGRSVAVAGDPNEIAVFYFGSTGGGVWKTTDGGQYWHNVSDGFFKRASVGGLAVAHSDPNVIYAGMGEATIRGNVSHGDGMYRSTDAGKTWTHCGLAATRNIAKVRVDPRDPNTVFVAALGHAHGPNPERGVYRSTNGGETWDLVLSRGEDAGASDLQLDPRNPRIVYAGCWEARRGPHYLTSGGAGGGLFKSTDRGTTWTDLTHNPGLPKMTIGKIGLAVSPAKDARVWAIVEAEKGGVFRSDDGGETWTLLNEQRELRQRAWYYSHICADPLDPETVWVLNVELYKSIDGGKTFERVPAPHGDNHDFWIDPANPQRIILGNDGGATVSYNGGLSWSSQYNQPTAEMYHVTTDGRNPYRVYGAQQDNTTMSVPSRSNYDVITMTEYYEIGGGESGYIAVRPDNPNIVFAGNYMGQLTRYDHSTGQLRWITVWPEEYSGFGAKDYKYRFNWTSPTVLSPQNPNILYSGGNHVFRSEDEGSSWTQISPDLTRADPSTLESSGGPITKDNTGAEAYATVFTVAESPKKTGVLWAGSDDGLVHVSQDGGKKWKNVTPPDLPEWALISIIDASPHDAGTAFVAATRYKLDDFNPYLYKTTDFGKTWKKIVNGIAENDFTRVVREDPNYPGLLYSGTETGIYASFDNGNQWHRLGGNLPVVPIHDFVFAHNDLVVGTHGRSFWILDDLTLLHQIAKDGSGPAVKSRLFKPRVGHRYSRSGGFGSPPVPGKNFTFAGGMMPAYMYEKTPEGEEKRTYLDAGENPLVGVLVHYQLTEEPKQPITLTFMDKAGNEIRTVKSKESDKEEVKEEDKPFPPEGPDAEAAKEEEPYVSTKVGLNQFAWDMRHANATKIASKGGHQPDRKGPVVPPGEYQVQLKVGPETFTERFEVAKDPRICISQKDLEAQYALAMKIHDKHNDLNKAINQIRAMRGQAESWARRAKEEDENSAVIKAAKELSDAVGEIEGELMQVKIQSEQDSLNFPVKLNAKLSFLGETLQMADAAPTAQDVALYEELAQRIDDQVAALKKATGNQLKNLNKAIEKANIPPVG